MASLEVLEYERFSQLELKLKRAVLSPISNKPGFKTEPELKLCTSLTNFSEKFILPLSYLPAEILFEGCLLKQKCLLKFTNLEFQY